MTAPFDPHSAIDRYFDEELDPATFAQLQQWLTDNPAAAAQFAERAFLHSRLSKMHARSLQSVDASLESEVAEEAQSLAEQMSSSTSPPVVKSPLLGFL